MAFFAIAFRGKGFQYPAYSAITKLVRLASTDIQIIFLYFVPGVLYEVGGFTLRGWVSGNGIKYLS